MNALKDGWMRELLFFVELLLVLTERPLRWGTFSLSYRFSKQPPTSVLSCLPASSSVASAAHFFSFTQLVQSAWQPAAATSHSTRAALWSRTTFRAAVTARVQPQLQTHLPGASQHHPRFVARSRAIAFAPNRPTCVQRWQWGLDHVSFFYVFYVKNRALATVWCAFCRQLFQIEGNRDPTAATPGARSHIARKNARFRAWECFHQWIQTLPNICHDDVVDMMMWLEWWWEC